jgi:hypothetical protein
MNRAFECWRRCAAIGWAGLSSSKAVGRAKVNYRRRAAGPNIVALKLRGIPTTDVARVIGVSRQGVNKAFKKALHRETSRDIQTHHRVELAKLDMEEANVWRTMDANKAVWQVQMSGTSQLRGIHIRRAHLLGLDAPTRLDVRGLYRTGESELSEESRRTELAWLSMPPEERAYIYDSFDNAVKRLDAPVETTADLVTLGPDNRTDDVEPGSFVVDRKPSNSPWRASGLAEVGMPGSPSDQFPMDHFPK